METRLARLGRITHAIIEDTERLRKGLMEPGIGADPQTASRVALHVALCLHGWPWQEAETFANKEFPRSFSDSPVLKENKEIGASA